MKKSYFALWALLACALAAVFALSAFSPVSVGSFELKDSGMYEYLTQSPQLDEANLLSDSVCSEVIAALEAKKPAPIDTAKKTILFVGDSMLEGLSPRLAAYAKHNGHKLYSVIWYSSTSAKWGNSNKLRSYIKKIEPDFIFISLGANELFVSDIAKKREQFVKNIIADVDTIPYLWIGPPNWKPDTGINDLVAANAAEGCFFLSNGMQFDRAKDGAHPTRKSAQAWMDSVIRWMPQNSPAPFVLNVPVAATASANRIFVHQPNEQ